MRLDPKHLTLNGALQGRLFRIPDYQRAYAWGNKQRKDLFADIDEAHRSDQDHFMATIVCLARDNRRIAADEFQVVEIVDGQQRLTTFIILLKAIEKSLNETDPGEAKIKREIGELLVKGDEHSLLLLQTNHDSSSVFVDYIRTGKIQDEAITSADKNLIEAALECEEFVNHWKKSDKIVDLVAILRNKLSFIYHEISDEAAVYRVFEVLNSRGLDVKWIDKLKSQLMALIFKHADDGARKEALKEMHVTWQEIYRVLGLRGSLGDEALRFAGTLKNAIQPNRLLSEESAAEILTKAAGTDIKSIVEVGKWLKSVVIAVDKLDQNVRLRAVTRIVHARFLAAAIILKGFSEKSERDLLARWERVTFRIFGLGDADTRHKVGAYIRLGFDIIVNNNDEKTIANSLTEIGNGYSITEVLDKKDWSNCYEGWSEELRYLLYRYDEHQAKNAGEKINESDWNKIWNDDPSKSIEHILPQSSGAKFVHELGNLTMLPPGVNSSLKNCSPKDKVSKYKEQGLKETRRLGSQIAETGIWDEDAVKNRTTEIKKFVAQEWAN